MTAKPDRDRAAQRPAASLRRDGPVRHRQAAGQLRMRLRAATWPLAALLGALPLASAFADSLPPVPVRVGNHEGYSRVVFNLPSRTDYHVTQEGQHVVVQFAGDVMIGAANGVPRNVLTVTGGAGRAEIVVAPGTIVRDWRLGNVVVIDFMDRDAAADKPTTQQTVAAQPPPANTDARRHTAGRACGSSRPTASSQTVARRHTAGRASGSSRPTVSSQTVARRHTAGRASGSSRPTASSQTVARRHTAGRASGSSRPTASNQTVARRHTAGRSSGSAGNRLQPNRRPRHTAGRASGSSRPTASNQTAARRHTAGRASGSSGPDTARRSAAGATAWCSARPDEIGGDQPATRTGPSAGGAT